MAVRFDADGESYTRSTGLTTVTVWSFCCWVKLAVDRATTTVLLQIDNGSGTSRFRINAWNGTALTHQTDSGGWFGTIGHSLTVGAWSFVGISGTSNPGQVRSAARSAGSTTWAGGTTSQTNVTFNAATLRVGDGQAANEWLNGSLAAVKIWDQALTMEELQNESWTYQPKRTAGLRGWYPLLAPATTDYSGSAQTLSGGTGAVLDDPPPITWSAGRRRIFIPSAGVAGSVSGTLPALTATSNGAVDASAQFAGTLPALTAGLNGAASVSATLPAVLPPLAASLSGVTDLPAGELVGTLPPLTAAVAGAAEVTGTLGAALPALGGSFTDVQTGDFDFATAGLSRGWTARDLEPAWAGLDVAAAWAARDMARDWDAAPGREWTATTLTV